MRPLTPRNKQSNCYVVSFGFWSQLGYPRALHLDLAYAVMHPLFTHCALVCLCVRF